MARRHDVRSRHLGVAGLALLGVVLLIALLVVGGWRAGLLTARPGDLSMRLPEAPALPLPRRERAPDPAPMPLPNPGPGVAGR